MSYDIVPADLAVRSMRDNGYKNAAYAIAELIDNSIQAEATKVELLIGERYHYGDRSRTSLDSMAVLDNGIGMSPDVLQIALQFGNGTHIEKGSQNGIGKFGMGLPAASISQCRCVEVYSWQDGIDSSFYTYIDIDKIAQKEMKEIPQPVKKKVPPSWQDIGTSFGVSGTLVVWTKIDRCHWKKGNTIINHSEMLIGRMYRRFLQNNLVTIRMHTFDVERDQKSVERFARPNDPLYLMSNTSCAKPWDQEPMFEKWHEPSIHPVQFRGETHEVIVRYSIAKKEARDSQNAGGKEHGKHARQNVGLSIVRADREITIDTKWAIQYDPVERWWGVEVEFPPALDEIFGLTNNKQSAAIFEDLAIENLKELFKDGTSFSEYKRELEENNDPAAYLLDIVTEINNNLKLMRQKLADQTKGMRSKKEQRSRTSGPEDAATDETKKRKEDGHSGVSDEGETKSEIERIEELKGTFLENGYTEEEAEQIAKTLLLRKSKYRFETKYLESSSFFSVRPQAGILIIYLNKSHPAYVHLIELLDDDLDENESNENLRDRLLKARDGLFLLLAAWARYEDEQLDSRVRDQLQDVRTDWGKVARNFLRSDE